MASFLPAAGAYRGAPRAYYRGRDLSRAQTIGDLRAMGLSNLPDFMAEYIEGGAEEELTLRRNRTAFESILFHPRVLREAGARDLSRILLERPSALPVVIAPTGFNGMFWPQGDLHLARAAARAGIPMTQSTVSNAAIVDVAATPGLRHWFQLYCFGPDSCYEALIDRALACGAEALLVTVDSPAYGNREWDRRNYARSPALSLRSKLDILRHPRWLRDIVLRHGLPRFVNLEEFTPDGDRNLFAVAKWTIENSRPDIDWAHIARMRARWPRKLLIKGVQNIADVRLAVEAVVDGIVLSNHGGRQLDRAAAPFELVAQARAVAGPDFTILVDSGFRRGVEIVAALALGADGVLLGRATLYGLAAGGEAGVTRALDILRSEIDRTLALLGVRSLAELSPDLLR